MDIGTIVCIVTLLGVGTMNVIVTTELRRKTKQYKSLKELLTEKEDRLFVKIDQLNEAHKEIKALRSSNDSGLHFDQFLVSLRAGTEKARATFMWRYIETLQAEDMDTITKYLSGRKKRLYYPNK